MKAPCGLRMWLLGRLYPDYKSISEFRRMLGTQCVERCFVFAERFLLPSLSVYRELCEAAAAAEGEHADVKSSGCVRHITLTYLDPVHVICA
jgi:hypothetical protein